MIVDLSKGDILKRDEILWNYTMEEVKPYMKYIERDLLFREAVIRTLIDESKSQKSIEDRYCNACKAAGKDDCKNCTRDIKLKE